MCSVSSRNSLKGEGGGGIKSFPGSGGGKYKTSVLSLSKGIGQSPPAPPPKRNPDRVLSGGGGGGGGGGEEGEFPPPSQTAIFPPSDWQ